MKENEQKNWVQKISESGDFETPYMLLDLDVVRQKALNLKRLLPRVGIYYAIKCNSDPRIIQELDSIVDGFDIASEGEYRLLTDLGVAPDRMVYSNPVKVPRHIANTFKGGVRYYAFDSHVEILKLKEHAPGSTVYLRLKVSDYGSKFPLSSKFGLDMAHAVDYASIAQDAGLHVKGLTFHVGSQAENPHVWEAAIKSCGSLIEELATKGIDIEFLDIGGGLPAQYEDVAPTVNEAAKAINEALDAYIPEHIRVFAEPGRYLSANAGVIVTSIIGREHRSGTDWLYVDMGVFQGLLEPLEMPGWKYPIFTQKPRRGYKKTYVLTGPTCDAYDTLGLDYSLPSDLNVDDKLFIGATGAYSLAYGSAFNGFEVPAVHYVGEEV